MNTRPKLTVCPNRAPMERKPLTATEEMWVNFILFGTADSPYDLPDLSNSNKAA